MLANPLLFVTALPLFDSEALAPDPGAANCTVTPEIGLFPASVTLTCRAVAKAVLMVADWGVPALAVMELAAPAVFVNANAVEADVPTMVAVT